MTLYRPTANPNTKKMRKEYEALIKDMDGLLYEARAMWMEAHETDKPKRFTKINELLDRRLSLMRARDAAQELNA
jgi:hypothetical protein